MRVLSAALRVELLDAGDLVEGLRLERVAGIAAGDAAHAAALEGHAERAQFAGAGKSVCRSVASTINEA